MFEFANGFNIFKSYSVNVLVSPAFNINFSDTETCFSRSCSNLHTKKLSFRDKTDVYNQVNTIDRIPNQGYQVLKFDSLEFFGRCMELRTNIFVRLIF